jgi:hypothetical protein
MPCLGTNPPLFNPPYTLQQPYRQYKRTPPTTLLVKSSPPSLGAAMGVNIDIFDVTSDSSMLVILSVFLIFLGVVLPIVAVCYFGSRGRRERERRVREASGEGLIRGFDEDARESFEGFDEVDLHGGA